MNTRFLVGVVIMMGVGSYAYQPAFGQCVTNKVKGTTFSNCVDAASPEIQKLDGVKFKESADDDELSQHLTDKSSMQFKEDAPKEGKDGVPLIDKKSLHLFKEAPRDLKSK